MYLISPKVLRLTTYIFKWFYCSKLRENNQNVIKDKITPLKSIYKTGSRCISLHQVIRYRKTLQKCCFLQNGLCGLMLPTFFGC